MNKFWQIVRSEEERAISNGNIINRDEQISQALFSAINEITEGHLNWEDFKDYWEELPTDAKIYSRMAYEIDKNVVKEMTEFCKFFEYNPFDKWKKLN